MELEQLTRELDVIYQRIVDSEPVALPEEAAEDLELLRTLAREGMEIARINLPDTHLQLPSLTETDMELLPFVCENADIVGYSFVRNEADVSRLYEELAKLGNREIGVVFKIENKEAFQNPPLILLEAMKRDKTGVATRAEVSDAAVSAQAECVMLNKGPHIVEAVRTLKSIISKMESHSFKRKNTLRSLSVAGSTLEKLEG